MSEVNALPTGPQPNKWYLDAQLDPYLSTKRCAGPWSMEDKNRNSNDGHNSNEIGSRRCDVAGIRVLAMLAAKSPSLPIP